MPAETTTPFFYLLPDPQHEYGQALEQAMQRLLPQASPIYLFESTKEAVWRQPFYPHVNLNTVQKAFYKDLQLLPEIAQELQSLGVKIILPYFEQSMLDAAFFQETLQLEWNSTKLLRLFRHKANLKQHIQLKNPAIALGAFHYIQDSQDLQHIELPETFVLKPVDGFGNRSVAFFQKSSSIETMTEHLRNIGGNGAILEEAFHGVEYCVNGQMDEQGRPIIVSVLRYDRMLANGKPNVSHLTLHVPPSDPHFITLTTYAQQIMQVLQLQRCPFHMELMLTKEGPRLIEIAARLPGTGLVFLTNSLHGGQFNWFDMAAHYYSSNQPYQGAMPNWTYADSISAIHLDGISTVHQPMYQIDGLAMLEQHPAFQRWVRKPRVGQKLQKTVDLYSVPFSFQLRADKGDEQLAAIATGLEQAIVFNQDVQLYQEWLTRLEKLTSSLYNHLRWKQHLQRQQRMVNSTK